MESCLGDTADLAGHFGHQVDREYHFLVALQRRYVPHEDVVGCAYTIRNGIDELRAARDLVHHNHVVRGGCSDIPHANLECRLTIHLDFIRSGFFDHDRRRLLTFESSITRNVRREIGRVGRRRAHDRWRDRGIAQAAAGYVGRRRIRSRTTGGDGTRANRTSGGRGWILVGSSRVRCCCATIGRSPGELLGACDGGTRGHSRDSRGQG